MSYLIGWLKLLKDKNINIIRIMGLYMYINEQDRVTLRELTNDTEMNEAFQQALKYDSSLMIREYQITVKSFWRKKLETRYWIYHDCNPNESPYQARYQMSASGKKESVIAYLHGIINGANAAKRK